MSLDDLVTINISASTNTPSKPGFGTILIAAQKVPVAFTNRVRTFGSVKEMIDFGFAVDDPAVLCATKIKAQNPTVTNFKVGKRLHKLTQTIELTCLDATEGHTYALNVAGHDIAYTVLAAATTTTVATAIAALIDALSEVAATSSTNKITITTTAGELFNVKGWSSNLQLRDKTTDPGGSNGLNDDLTAIYAEDREWYGLALDSQSPAETAIAALFVEANKKIFSPNTSDYDCEDSVSTTDIMYVLKAAAYARTGCLYSRAELLSYSGPAWMGKQFVAKPGSDTWAYKTLATVTVDTLTAGARTAILNKNGNVYESVSSINITEFGKSSAGEWFDITRFIDWLAAEAQFRVFNTLANNAKVAYTDDGVDLLLSQIDGALEAGVDAGGLVKGTTSVTAPLVADIDPATRNTRRLNGVKFGGRLAGAIHTLDIAGSLTT